MPLSLGQLLTPVTEQQALDSMLATLRELGFRTTSWQTGSAQLSILRAVARMHSGVTGNIRDIAGGGLLGISSGPWLRLLGMWFGVPLLEAVATEGNARWRNPASGSPLLIQPGSIIEDVATLQRFATTNAVAVPLAANTTATIPIRAMVPGAAGNIAIGSTFRLVTPYPGATVTLLPLAPPDSDEWITTTGADEEDTSAGGRYSKRLELRWSQLTYAVGFRAYEFWALTAAPSVTRVRVLQNYPTENLVRVVLANATGTASSDEVDAVADYIDDNRRAINDVVEVSSADIVAEAITLTPRIRLGTTTTEQVEDAILALVNAIPIGGTLIAGAAAGRLLRDQIITAVGSLPGVTSVGLVEPAADVVLGGTDIVAPIITVTPEFFSGQA